MKKIILLLNVSILLFTACNNGNTSSDGSKKNSTSVQTSSGSNEDCVEGKYSMTEQNVTRNFVFKKDKTGQEEYTSTDIRPFSWSLKDDKTIHIIYNEGNAGYDLNFDCTGKSVSWSGAKYTKQ